MNKLPDECFLNIIEQLIKSYQDALNQCCHTRRTSNRSSNNDKNEAISNILFSCILVNRYWCRNVLPILWSKPFRFLHKPLPGLIQVYVSCLNEKESKVFLSIDTELPSITLPSPLAKS
ncbi:4312_t:CDS:1 [Entrophospora sp. SA101]|nr:4312_t:CDS:1 [Entrophospora sp. SA101]